MDIQTATGTKTLRLTKFKALDGWALQNGFINFAASRDNAFRKEYTLKILAYAVVVNGEQEIPLSTDALIDNHLQTWQNVMTVFEEILSENGIDPKTHADRPDYWSNVGREMATSFLASCSELIKPALEHAEELRVQSAESQG